MQGREKETKLIRRANRASAVGKLMLGEIHEWKDFLESDITALENLPRKQLKSGKHDVQDRLSSEIKKFCDSNFEDMTINKLDSLYEDIKAYRGLEIPLENFEAKYSKLRPNVKKDIPPYSTVAISLWGLKFKYPEHFISRDITQALSLAMAAREDLNQLEKISHREAVDKQSHIARLIQQEEFANRSIILSCYNLLEAYLNGLAWTFAHDKDKMEQLSNNSRKLIEDSGRVSIKEKAQKYPSIIAGRPLWSKDDDPPKTLLTELKYFRDSIVHSSPFSVPEQFGGYDKLHNLYMINIGISMLTARHTVDMITSINQHINGTNYARPVWLGELATVLDQYEITYSAVE